MTRVCDSLVKNIYKNHNNLNNNYNNYIYKSNNDIIPFNNLNRFTHLIPIYNSNKFNIPYNYKIHNNNFEITHNEILKFDKNNEKNVNNIEILKTNKSSIENKSNYSNDNNDEELKNNDNNANNTYNYIKNANHLKKHFTIGRATGDGNCLFYSLSTATFGTDVYFNEIRNAICDYMEKNDIEDLYDINKQDYIAKMRKNGAYGGTTEIQIYSIISNLKIYCFMRTLQSINNFKADNSDTIYSFIAGKNYTDTIYIMLNIKNTELFNHYVPLTSKASNNELSKEKRMEIKKTIGVNIDKSKEKVKSILTGKPRGTRIGKSDWNPIYIDNNNKKCYTIDKNKTNKYSVNNKAEIKLNDCIHLNQIIDEFKNVNNIGIETFKNKYRNIIINDIVINEKTYKVDSDCFKNILKLSENTLDNFTNVICYDCSGFNKNNKPMFRIFRSLKYLKIHFRDIIDHRKDLSNCIFNYDLPNDYVEIETKKSQIYYLINKNDLINEDKIRLNNKLKGGKTEFNNDENTIKIYGNNVRTLNESNRALIINFIEEEREWILKCPKCVRVLDAS